jgi:hypothetical protein
MYRENESSNSPAGGRPCHARETTVGICDGQINRSQFFSRQKTGGLGSPSWPASSNPSLRVAFAIGWPTGGRENCAGLRTRSRMKGCRSLEKTGRCTRLSQPPGQRRPKLGCVARSSITRHSGHGWDRPLLDRESCDPRERDSMWVDGVWCESFPARIPC